MYEFDEKIIAAGLGKYRSTVFQKCVSWNKRKEIRPVCFLENENILLEKHWHKEFFVVLDLCDSVSVRKAAEYSRIFRSDITENIAGFSAAIVPEEQLRLPAAEEIFKNFDRVVCFRSVNEIFCFIEIMSLFSIRDGFIGLDLNDVLTNTEWENEGHITKTVFYDTDELHTEMAFFIKKFFNNFKSADKSKMRTFVVMELPFTAELEDVEFIVNTASYSAETTDFIFQVYFNENKNSKSATVYLLSGEEFY